MGKYYIYCNSNQVYHALIHNSVMSKSLTRDDFRASTLSFEAEYAIFVTHEKLPVELVNVGATDVYYPVVLEIEVADDATEIPARFVIRNEEGISVSEELSTLAKYADTDKCVGAFVYGELPICILTGVLFANEQEMVSFSKSSPDLWFPREMFALFVDDEEKSLLTKEEVDLISKKADEYLTEEAAASIRKTVTIRNKAKAALYYMVDATADWSFGNVKTNVDGTLIRYLDDSTLALKQSTENAAADLLQKDPDFKIESLFESVDEVLDKTEDNTQKTLYGIIKQSLCMMSSMQRIDKEVFNQIAISCIDAIATEEKALVIKGLQSIDNYVYARSEMDPDKVLSDLDGMPVLKAFMFFLDQQQNIDFLRNASKKLSQHERRYAYMMFGWYHGMPEVEGTMKSNRALESRLFGIVAVRCNDDAVLSAEVKGSEAFRTDASYGIVPALAYWYGCESSHKLLMEHATEKQLEDIYILMKDATIPAEELYKLSEPIIITVSFGGKEQRFELVQTEGIDGTLKEIKRSVAKIAKNNKRFDAETFRKFFADPKRYQKFFKKHSEKIQALCRKVKK